MYKLLFVIIFVLGIISNIKSRPLEKKQALFAAGNTRNTIVSRFKKIFKLQQNTKTDVPTRFEFRTKFEKNGNTTITNTFIRLNKDEKSYFSSYIRCNNNICKKKVEIKECTKYWLISGRYITFNNTECENFADDLLPFGIPETEYKKQNNILTYWIQIGDYYQPHKAHVLSKRYNDSHILLTTSLINTETGIEQPFEFVIFKTTNVYESEEVQNPDSINLENTKRRDLYIPQYTYTILLEKILREHMWYLIGSGISIFVVLGLSILFAIIVCACNKKERKFNLYS